MLKRSIIFATLSAILLISACSKSNNTPDTTHAATHNALNLNKTYIVATDATYPPMEYMNNNQVVGFSHDILDAAAQSQHVKLQFINIPFDSLFANVNKGDSDIGLASITINKERQEQLDFSNPYFKATQMVVMTETTGNGIKTLNDLKDHTVSVQSATSGDIIMQKLQGNTSTKIKRFENMPLAFKELENNGVDAVVGDSSAVNFYIKQNPNAKLYTFIDSSFTNEEYGFAFKKGRDDGLREAINKGLAQIKTNGTYDKIYQQWFGNKDATATNKIASQPIQ